MNEKQLFESGEHNLDDFRENLMGSIIRLVDDMNRFESCNRKQREIFSNESKNFESVRKGIDNTIRDIEVSFMEFRNITCVE